MDEVRNRESQDQDAELSRDYNGFSLLLLVLPAIFTFVFIAVYQIIDGVFIGYFVGPYAIAAVNLYYPVISILLAVGVMMGTGANVRITELLGAGRKNEADSVFSQTILLAIAISVIFAIVCSLFADPIMRMLGASDGNMEYLRFYYATLCAAAPAIMMQTILGILIIGEGKNVLTAVLILVGGGLNILLDYLFMGVFHWGIRGAAIATAIGYLVPVLYAFYFYSPKGGSKYRFQITKIQAKPMLGICYNGSSEMVSTLASGVTALLMNHLAFRFHQEVGVSVVSVFLYVQFIIMAVFMGMATAVEPLFSYHHGSGNIPMRKKLFRLSALWTGIFSLLFMALLWIFCEPIVGTFFQPTGDSEQFFSLASRCLYFSVPACLFVGFNTLVSGLFTAFSNGTVSALLSGIRTFVVLSACLLLLSRMFGADGLWAAWAVTEGITFVISLLAVWFFRKKYQYF